MNEFGCHAYVHGVVIYGTICQKEWIAFLHALVAKIGMKPAAEMTVTHYDGGIGEIYFQPIIESFIAIDVWPNHKAAYLHVASCRPFSAQDVNAVTHAFGLRIGQQFNRNLSLAHE